MSSKPYAGISCSLFLVLNHICFSLYQIWPQVHTVDTPEQVCVCVYMFVCWYICLYTGVCLCLQCHRRNSEKIVCVN